MISEQQLEKFISCLPSKRMRIQLSPSLWEAFTRTFPGETTGGRSREILAKVIDLLGQKGFSLPSQRSKHLFDRNGTPHLPAWIQRPRQESVQTLAPSQHIWATELSFLANATNLKNMHLWLDLDAWLKKMRNRHLDPIPMRERSFEIFGDEKALDSLVKSRPFVNGQISIETLGCFHVYEPLAMASGPSEALGKPCLVVENAATYYTLAKWNKKTGKYSCIAYGGGGRFEKMWEGLLPLQKEFAFDKVSYFGDLDAAGLNIPFRASRLLKSKTGIPLQLDTDLFLLAIQAAANTTLPQAPKKRKTEEGLWDWIPAPIRESLHKIIQDGYRIPQEILTKNNLPERPLKSP